MLHEHYHDPVKVLAVFDGERVQPKAFKWGAHTYTIAKVTNVHSTFDGRERIFFFSLATETEFFRIEFHTETLTWLLVEHYQE